MQILRTLSGWTKLIRHFNLAVVVLTPVAMSRATLVPIRPPPLRIKILSVMVH